MAESDSAPSTSLSLPITPSRHTHTTPPRVPRIRFPDHFLAAAAHGESSRSFNVFPHLPIAPMTPDSKNIIEPGNGKRRPHSMDVTPVLTENSPSKRSSPRSADFRRKSKRMTHQKLPALKDSLVTEFEPSAFSDEYDLSHEDPKILQDVQRALELQSRRRDRKSFTPSQSTVAEGQTPVDLGQNATSFQSLSLIHASPPDFIKLSQIPSDIDFSPSVQPAPLHPVPLSSNGGATLDWTGSQVEEGKLERRWTLGKRTGKERATPSNRTTLEKQDTFFADRISRIRSEAKLPTFRKAAIVSEQLGRRYNLVYSSISNKDPINLAMVARWYANAEPNTSAWLDSAEPLTWLKHLLDKQDRKRSMWHLSALIVEEYNKSNKTFPSLPVTHYHSTFAQGASLASDVSLKLTSHPLHPINSSCSLPHSFGDSLRRIRSSDGHVSFEPKIDSARSSIDGDHKSTDNNRRGSHHALPALADPVYIISSTSSPYGRQNSPNGLSPTSSRIHFPEFVQRMRRRQVESDEGSSSAINSQSEDYSWSPNGIVGRRRKTGDRSQTHAPPSRLQSPHESGTNINVPNETPDIYHATLAPVMVVDPLSSKPASELDIGSSPDKLESEVLPTVPRVIPRHKLIYRTSLPVTGIAEGEQKHCQKAAQDELEHEYEIKSHMLDILKAQNHRLRQKLQRIASEVREYDLLQARFAHTHGIPRRALPQELLDAFSHDPSSVTGGTRSQSDWRAVEDIHARILRQRQVFRVYLSVADNVVSVPDSLLDEPISSLMFTLGEVEHKMEVLTNKELEVASALTHVKSMHTQVKNEYNNTLSHTSVVYPELSQIIALEESYRDQYQQVWEFGMDALTFILDTVAPFWRNYGRTIGEDIKDFLIIPWYRNEFTGEPKRYDILTFPRRSVQHWFALSFLFWLAMGITFLQTRAAIFCTFIYKLPWTDNFAFQWLFMPFTWIVIVILWLAAFFEACLVILQMSVVAWWLGWLVGLLM